MATKAALRDSGLGLSGPAAQGRAGSSSGQPQDARAFRKGDAGKWLESLKNVDSDDTVAFTQLYQQCARMDEAEAAELLERCVEILALEYSEDSNETGSFSDFTILATLAEQAAARLASLSPEKALAIVKSSKELMQINTLMACTFGAIAGVDPGLAIAEAQRLDDPSAAVTGIMSPLLAANDLVRAELLLKLCPENPTLERRFLDQALKSDPDLAVRKGCEFAASGSQSALTIMLSDPATRDKAVEWASTYQGPEAEEIRGDLFKSLTIYDSSQAAAVYSRMAPGMSEEDRGGAAGIIAVTMSRIREDWESWLGSLDGSARQTALVAVIENDNDMGRGRTEGADPDRRVVLSRAEELFNQMPASPEKETQLGALAQSLIDSQPEKARLWLDQMPEGDAKAKLQREIELQAELKILRPPK